MQHPENSDESKLLLVCDVQDTHQSIRNALDTAFVNGFGLISYPLIDPKHDTPSLCYTDNFLNNIPFAYHSNTRAATFQFIYGKISPWITFNPYNNYLTQQCTKLLQHELEWCLHLGIYSIILPNPQIAYPLSVNQTHTNGKSESEMKVNDNAKTEQKTVDDSEMFLEIAINYASAMTQAFKARIHLIGIIPIVLDDNGWKLWKSLSILLRDVKNVRPALILGKNAPSKELAQQWFAEGVQIFIISQDVFLTNKKGFPVLSKAHQKVLLRFLRWTDMSIIVKGNDNKNAKKYCQYLRHLRSTAKKLSNCECEEKPFWDVLQTPLQPLSHNLEYATYETFESDPIKYNQYEKAITQCLIDLDKKVNLNDNTQRQQYIVMVLGAGRGPLVTAALKAAKSTGVKIKLYAIEKNPHAIIILKNKNNNLWNKSVTIVEEDMRTWKYSEKAHIIISELLGSFGDNELSPECLDGAQRLLRDDGVSIPYKYSSYVCPMTNNSIYSKLTQKPHNFEIPYVIHLVRHSLLSKDIQKCWSFTHPNKNEYKTNKRYCKLSFKINNNISKGDIGSVIHGFAGYFDTVLYKDVILSIHPYNASKGMFSWFPMYFPLINPIKVKLNDIITVHFWRKCDTDCVWYEWCVTKPILTEIHNANHRSYAVNLQ